MGQQGAHGSWDEVLAPHPENQPGAGTIGNHNQKQYSLRTSSDLFDMDEI
jgi:hypothetical protein